MIEKLKAVILGSKKDKKLELRSESYIKTKLDRYEYNPGTQKEGMINILNQELGTGDEVEQARKCSIKFHKRS